MTANPQIPHALEAEEALIGSVIMDPESYIHIDLSADQFYSARNRTIWGAIGELVSAKKPVDYITLADELSRQKKLDEVGGQAYLTQLITSCANIMNAAHYADIVREKAKRRAVIESAKVLATAAYNPESELDSIVAKTINDLVMNARAASGAVHIREFANRLYDEVEARCADPKEIYGIPTGLAGFDRITSGLQKGEMFLLSGEPGLGKSLLAAQMAFSMARNGTPGAFYEMEMIAIAILRREISNMSRVKVKQMRSGNMDEAAWADFIRAIGDLSNIPMYLSDSTAWTTISLRADLARLKQTFGIQWFVVDYLDLLNDTVPGGNYIEKSATISRQLHNICKDLDLAGLAIQTMNKNGLSSQQPGKENLSGSVKVSYDADQIAILTKDESKDNVVWLRWDKNREGEGDSALRLVRKPGFPAFFEVASDVNAR